jgi:hypothetical protein
MKPGVQTPETTKNKKKKGFSKKSKLSSKILPRVK